MKKLFTLLSCVTFCLVSLSAQQTGTIKGVIVDKTTKEPVIGAVIEMYNTSTPGDKKGYSSGMDGAVSMRGLAYGEYHLKITFLGYNELSKTVNLNASSLDMGTIELEENRISIDKVNVEAQAIRTSLKGDTVSYNANAFKVAVDADVERLISKMPGITVIDGKVEAQGEEVKKVLVDGKEFFGQDVTTALKNLPADMVDRIEVYDKLSDQAEFTGIDDGEGYKAINIVTALDKRSGQFGKLAASYGYPDYYFGSAAVNIFQGDSRISLLGLVNNLNQKNFSFEDIVGATTTGGGGGGGGWGASRNFMVRPEPGIATVQAFGVNYMDKWGKNDKVDVTGSYFFNHSNTVNTNQTQEWFTNVNQNRTEYTDSETESEKDNFNHRFDAKIEYKPDESQSLMIRPNFSYQKYDNYSYGTSLYDFTNAGITDMTVDKMDDRNSVAYNAGLNVLYRTRLGKAGRTLTVNANGNMGMNDGTFLSSNYIFYPPTRTDSTAGSRIINDSRNYRLGGSLTYTEPLSVKSSLNLEYRADYSYEDANQWTYLLQEMAANGDLIFMDQYDEELSNISNSGYLTQRVSPGYRYSDKTINFNANVTYQNSSLSIDQTLPARDPKSHSFNNFLYSARLRYNINTANSLNLHLNSNTRNPSISQLQDVVNTNDSQRPSSGNPDLKPYVNHRLFLNYNHSNAAKGYTFGVNLSGSVTDRYIANHVHTDSMYVVPGLNQTLGELGPGTRFTQPENMDGYWNVRAGINFGFPINFIKSNFNFQLGGSYSNIPSMTDFVSNMTRTKELTARATLGSNISENIDFMLTYWGSYGLTNYTTSMRDSKVFQQNATASLKWVIWKGITFSANASYRQYYLPTENTNEQYFICNALIGTKIFKNKRGELSLVVNDLFNQNKSYFTWISNNTITNSSNLEIGRYVGIQFIYNLRMYGKGASRRSSDYDGLDQDSSGSFRQQGQQQRMGGFHGRPPGM